MRIGLNIVSLQMNRFFTFGLHIGDIGERKHPPMDAWIPELNEQLSQRVLAARIATSFARAAISSAIRNVTTLSWLQSSYARLQAFASPSFQGPTFEAAATAWKPSRVRRRLTACMRKLLVNLNAMLKHRTPWCHAVEAACAGA